MIVVDLDDLDSPTGDSYFLDGEPFSGEATETAGGVLRARTTFVDGIEEGPHDMWHANGKRALSCVLHRGNPVGEAWTWDDEGQLESIRYYTSSGWPYREDRWNKDGLLIESREWDAPAGGAYDI